jgi:hypothetical protein
VEEEGFMLLDTAVRTELARNFGGVLVVILTVELLTSALDREQFQQEKPRRALVSFATEL